MSSRNLWPLLAAIAGLVFLIIMVFSGALPQQRQLVKFQAKGLMKLDPDLVARVELHRGKRKAVLMRTAGGQWVAEGGIAPSAELTKKVSLAVQFMNTAGPIRLIEPAEFQGANPRDFGLDPPRVSVVLYRGEQTVIGARFGTHNPEDTAQYMMVDGRQELILMSRFVGQEWESVANEVLSK